MNKPTPETARPPLRLLVFGASLRTASLNDKLASLAAKTIEAHGATADRAVSRPASAPLRVVAAGSRGG